MSKIAGSGKNRRLIISYHRQCLVLIDTMEGPVYSLRLRGNDIKSIYSNREAGVVICLTSDGYFSVVGLSESIL